MNLPKRKQLRLQCYDYSRDGAYFITICTHKQIPLFGTITSDPIVGAHLCVRPHEPDQMIEQWLLELERKYTDLYLDAYVVMPNHIHFILISATGAHTGAPLPEIIQWFKTQTTNAYIRAVKSGLYPPFDEHIWQRNYYEHIIRDANELEEIRKYIRNNPGKWFEDKYYCAN